MRVDIKDVKACRNKAYGNYLLRGHNYATITVSRKLNPYLQEYMATTLHELLHLWMTLCRRNGFKLTDVKEHKFIYATEAVILDALQKYAKRRRHDDNKLKNRKMWREICSSRGV